MRFTLAIVTAFFLLSRPVSADDASDRNGVAYFEQHVRPILVQHCYKCHSQEAKRVRADLLLNTKAGWMKGGDNGPAIVPGKPDESLLIKAVRYDDDLRMPPKGKLSAKEIDALVQWVKMGAPDPRSGEAKPATAETINIEAARNYWAFQPLRHHVVPDVQHGTWCRTPIDRFMLSQLETQDLQPNPFIERRKLIRRAYFDLIGLPPEPEAVEAFVNDPAEDAYERLIDELLASPHFGERWGRHWLDLARFAESHGYEQDYDRPNAYHYRDFVIKAFNQDLPYDTFVKWQIAGDEYDPENPLALTATGFLAAGTHATQITANQAEKERYDELDDMIRTIGTSMLGLTIGCARCHDHKFDPIPTDDYYRLISTFSTTVRSDYDVNLDPQGYKEAKAAFDADHDKLRQALKQYEVQELAERAERRLNELKQHAGERGLNPDGFKLWYRFTDPDWWRLADPVMEHARQKPKPNLAPVLISSEGVPAVRLHTQGLDHYDPVHFLNRGDVNQKAEPAPQGFLQVLTRASEAEKHWQTPPPAGCRTSYRRRALAEWLTDVEHGAGHLLARVIVNRLWHYHMGRGIVATPSDFGKQGEKPTHPELLDWLALELIRHDWRLKPIHKLLMSSSVYMQNGSTDEAREEIDRDNKLYWKRSPRRLEAEIIRDAMLAVSGSLDRTMFGPGTLEPDHKRRSIYYFIKRSRLIPMMTLFDAPDALQDIPNRSATTVAPQALLLMNSPVVREFALEFAKRVARHSVADPPRSGGLQVTACYQLAFGREPTPDELKASIHFLESQSASYEAAGKPNADELALADFCQSLMSLNEFIYIE